MAYSIQDIAERTGLEAAGDLSLTILRLSEPASAGANDLALAMSEKLGPAVAEGRARAAVLWPGADWQALGLEAALYAPRSRLALSTIGLLFEPAPDVAEGVHASAVVSPEAQLGDGVAVGPLAVIGAGAEIGSGSVIAGQASIGRGVRLGPGASVAPGARLMPGVVAGRGLRVGANAVIGSDGFSYVTPERGAVEAVRAGGAVDDAAQATGFRRIPSLGGVEIGDDVEIGAGSCIDAGTIAPTQIGEGTKIDNLVQVGHNCRIGRLCLVCGHVGLAGSVTVGDRVVLGGKVGVGDHLTIGSDSMLGGGSLVGMDIAAGTVALGVPAVPRDQFFRQIALIRRLPRMAEQLRDMRVRLGM